MSDLRTPPFLSPSALGLFESNPDEYFFRYIVPKDIRPKREPQTDAMSVGSAFDALIKNKLHEEIYGRPATVIHGFRIRDLIVKQCDDHTLPEALEIASHLFEEYIEVGAYDDLLSVVKQSPVKPRMEFEVTSIIDGVPLLGKPDLHFQSPLCAEVITDFKISGAVSKAGVSPQQGYMVARDVRQSSTHGKPHAKFSPVEHRGGLTVSSLPMNETTNYWADQLATYAWCLGQPVGSEDFIVRIEQVACRPNKDGLRVKCCTHQSIVSSDYQLELLNRYRALWSAIQGNHIWTELSINESQARGDLLMRSLSSSDSAVRTPFDDIQNIDFSF